MTYLARLIAAGAHSVMPELPGIALTPDIVEAIVNDAWVVFNLSGGKDSTAAMSAVNLFLDWLGHSRDRRMAVHADLGRAEWATTSATVDRIAAEAGVPLTVVRRSAGDLVDRWLQRFESGKRRYEALETYNLIGPWSSASLRFCQSEMKSAVIGPAIAQRLRGQTIVSVLGLRRDESHNRAAIPISKADHRHAKAGNRHGTVMMVWNPIADWTSGDVFRAHQILGLLLHEAYTAYQATRLSCRYCIFASMHDLSASASAPANAEVYRELVDIEARSTFPFQPARWLADVAPHLLGLALRADIARAKADQLERRRLEAMMPPTLRYVKGWPPRVPTRSEAEDIATARRPILARHGLADLYPTASSIMERFSDLL
ncbi:phosphoadenosine phosphosulfate reductase family protein [Sphingobium chlorophenolicum]|uniref:Putative sulfurtransferase DndC n=1 Tax=Sphingobium chlorophenolicum TaxID=46429 RepID=A0A081REY6_SPHCR|nr:phosphoadenosine phosphosulfate reductase family protein [Sphingobium chlorophenolicum]KEQ53759.1 putative sulfurtransferase DndC [Sphingobium chlorophenolicum]